MSSTTSGERVLIVEDEPSTRVGLTELVRTWGFTADSAGDGEEALRRITEGAAMIRSKGEAGTGDVSEATKHIRTITGEINALRAKTKDELYVAAKELQAPYELVAEIAETGKLPVVLFTAGGVATPADAGAVTSHARPGGAARGGRRR